MEMAKYDICLVMDADLQHDPVYIESIVVPVIEDRADFSVGSRNVSGGGIAGDWPLIRRVISKGATALAWPLTSSSDPMSGFFCMRRDLFLKHRNKLQPQGYKIGLELMVRCGCKRILDVPIQFKDRVAGESKLTMKQNVLYLIHLSQLYWFKFSSFAFLLLLLLVVVVVFFFF